MTSGSNNKKITFFENAYNEILSELDFSKGGLNGANNKNIPAATNQTQQNGNQPQVQGGVKMQFSNNNNVNNNQQTPNNNVNNNTPQTQNTDPQETQQFTELMKLRQTNPDQFNAHTQEISKDPDTFSRFVDFLTQNIGK